MARRRGVAGVLAAALVLTACSTDPGVRVVTRTAGSYGVAITTDPDTRIVTLDNGLTVYLRHNNRPGRHAELRLAVNAGSGSETAGQSGVAHFLEHMLFNGTEQFPGNQLIDVLRGFGMEFGADVNAYTTYDETVYELSVNTDEGDHLGTGLDVLAQWLSAATIDEAQVVAERGVVLDEWRVRDQTSDGRLWAATEAQYLGGSGYDGRAPIGTDQAISAMTSAPLREFYDAWYRPDNAAVVVVGDIDVDEVEAMVRERFSTLQPRGGSPAQVLPAIGPFNTVAAHAYSDPDILRTMAVVGYPAAAHVAATTSDLRADVLLAMAFDMISTRLSDDVTRGEASYQSADFEYLDPVRTIDAPAAYVEANVADTTAAVDALLVEFERTTRYGFGQSELDRIVATYRATLDSEYESRNTVHDNSYAGLAVAHFLSGQPMPSAQVHRDVYARIFDSVTPQEVWDAWKARLAQSAPHLLVSVPEGSAVPADTDLQAMIASLANREIEPRANDAPLADSLMARPDGDKPDEIIEADTLEPGFFIDATRLVMDNGATVILNTNDIATQQVSVAAISPGGLSAVPAEDLWAARYSTSVAQQSGLGDLDAVQTATLLEGADATIQPFLAPATEGFSGGGSATDLELMFQQLHLYMSAPRFTQAALDTVLDEDRPYIADPLSDPDFASYDGYVKARFGTDARYLLVPTAAEADAITLAAVERSFRDRFSNASDWVFVVSGDFDEGEAIDLANDYIGTLDGNGTHEEPGLPPPPQPAGIINFTVHSGTGDTASLLIEFSEPMNGLHLESVQADLLTQVLQIRLTNHIREELGASYSPYAEVSTSAWPDSDLTTIIFISGAPGDMERLSSVAHADLNDIALHGPTAAELDQAVAALTEDYSMYSNDDIAWFLTDLAVGGANLDLWYNRTDGLTQYDAADIASFAMRVMPANQYIEEVVLPA